MMPLWTSAEIAAATGGSAPRPFAATGIAIDSRTTGAGDLFIALKGPNFDGHSFVGNALAQGAAGAMVAKRRVALAGTAPLVEVEDTMAALTALGRAGRARSTACIIGVTGSVGKTGTKEALRLALSGQGPTHASAGSLNNHWGLPLSLARMPRGTAYGIFELGMNHAGELAVLSPIARPHVAIITAIEPAHLGHFASLEAIADAKVEIFLGVEKGGAAILNRDNPFFARLAAAAQARGIDRILGFGAHEEAAVRLLDCRLGPHASAVRAAIMGESLAYTIALPGRHWVMNSLAVLAAVKAAGGDVAAAAASFARLAGLAGRGQRHQVTLPGGGRFDLIDESYNASPASMRAAIAVLGTAEPGSGGRRIAVLGSMLELGRQATRLHAELAEPLEAAGVDLVFTVGTEMEALRDALPAKIRGGHCSTAADMAALITAALRPGDVVTVKGSAGSRMGEVVKRLLAAETPPPSSAAAE